MIRNAVRLLPLLLAAGALQACGSMSGGNTAVASQALTPTEQFPIEVRQNPDEIRLAVHDGGLSGPQQAALSNLVDRWRETGGGEITIQAPRGAGEGQAALFAQAATRTLVDLGAPGEKIRLVGYQTADGQATAGKTAPLIVGFSSYQAVGPTCGHWDNLTATGSNKPYANFGCAQSANIAAMIANPHDLIAPQTMTPADATRRSVVLDKYRKGETSSTAKDDQATATTKPGG